MCLSYIFFVQSLWSFVHLWKYFPITGPDMWKTSRNVDGPFEDIPSSKVVLYYEAKACYKHVCKDLSLNDTPRDGRLTGHKIYTWDIKVICGCLWLICLSVLQEYAVT